MERNRLYSLRSSSGGYAVADYDPASRELTYVEVHGSVGGILSPVAAGDVRRWCGDGQPWGGASAVTAIDNSTGETVGRAGPFRAVWERAVEGQPPSPGYGPTKSVEESLLLGLIQGFAELAGAGDAVRAVFEERP